MKKRKTVASILAMTLITTSNLMFLPNLSAAEKEQKAYVDGYPDGSFAPDISITRAESVKLLINSAENDYSPDDKYDNSFTDVGDGWYKNLIGYAEKNSMIEGYGDGKFSPENSITRAEFVTIVSKMNGFKEGNETKFIDIDEHWAKEYITFAEKNGWVKGYGKDEFKPDDKITRAEAVKIINNVLGKKADKELLDSLENIKEFSDVSKEHWAYYDVLLASNTISDAGESENADDTNSDDKDSNSSPENPTKPEAPNGPGASENNPKPDVPTKPGTPTEPEKPEVPGEQVDPVEPSDPDEPVESDTPDVPEDQDDLETPDESEEWTAADFIIEHEQGYDGLTIKGFSDKGKEKFKNNKKIEFPCIYNGENIAAIGTEAFKDMGIESVVIPKEINTIGLETFKDNKIKKLVIPNGVEFIAMSAFENNEIESVELPESITDIRNKAFANNKLTELKLPNNIKKLYAYSFADNKIKDLVLPENVEEIEGNTFDTNKIERVNVPDSLTKLDPYSFYQNPGIKRMGDYSGRVAVYTVDGKNINNLKETFYILIDPEEDQNLTPVDPATEIGNGWQYDDFSYNAIYDVVTINGFTEKGAKKAETVKDVVLPDKDPRTGRVVTDIGEWAFSGWGLHSVEMPTRLYKIGVAAFENNRLSYLEFNNTLAEIQGDAFKGNNLTKINVPVATKKIDAYAFEGNPGAYKNRVAVFTANGMNNGLMDSEYQMINPKGLVDKDSVILGALQISIENAKSLDLEEYENEGIDEMKRILKESESMLSKEGVTQYQVNLKAKELNSAVEKLVKKPVEDDEVVEDPNYVPWELDNFDYEETTDYYSGIVKVKIKGFSEKGLAKLETDKILLLPVKNPEGKVLNAVSRSAFLGKKIDKVVIPGNYEYLESRAFEKTGLKEIVVNKGLKEIGSGTFGDNELTEVVLPKSVSGGVTSDAFDEDVIISYK